MVKTKIVLLNWYLSTKKHFRKIWMILDIENQILAFFDGYFWQFNKSNEKTNFCDQVMALIWNILMMRNYVLLPKLFWFTLRKFFSNDRKNLWNSRLKTKNFRDLNFEITGTIYSNIECSELFLATEYFFNLFLEVSHT